MDLFSKITTMVGRNGVVTEVVKKSETKTHVKAEATIQVASNDYRKQTYDVKKESNTQ